MLASELERGNVPNLQLDATARGSFAWIARPDGFIVWVSQQRIKVDGFRWQQLLDPALASEILLRWQQLTSTSEPFDFVLPLTAQDGHPTILMARVSPLLSSNGHVTHWICVSNGLPARRFDEARRPRRTAQVEAFLHQSAAGFAETDAEGHFIEVNQRYCEITGRTREELLTLRMQDITFKGDLPHNNGLFFEAVSSGRHFSIKKRYIRPDNSLVWVRNSISAVRDQAGIIQGAVCVSVDITKQIEAEEPLRQERGRAKSVLQNMDEAFLLLDHEYRVIDINTYALRLNKRAREEVIGTLLWDQWPGSEDLQFGYLYKRVMRDRKPRTIEQSYRWPDGRTAWIELRAYPAAEGLAIFFRDVTARKQAERNNAQLAAIVNCSHDAIISCTPEGTIETWNPAAEQLFGWSRSDALGQSASLLIAQDHECEIRQAFQSACQGKTVRTETVTKRKDGTSIHVSLALAPLYEAQGQVAGATAMIRDITELKGAEQLHKLLLGELSHRIKNSFSIIQALANQTFRSEGISKSARDNFFNRMRSLATSHELLIQRHWESAHLHQVLTTALKGLDDFSPRITLAGPEVVLPSATVIPLTMVIHELATNAMKYGSLSVPAGTVAIRWEKENSRLILCWQEQNGPRIVNPTASGFGSQLIRQALSSTGAQVTVDFQEEGLLCKIIFDFEEQQRASLPSSGRLVAVGQPAGQ